jgi:hypothetical protein
MNCKTFHRNLEDYLEGGLDFSGRFGMERHAQKCLSCDKELSDAQRLHRMVSELQRVKAPANFEASVLREIGMRKANSRFSGFRSFWVYGFAWPSLRKLALASSCLAVLFFGIFYASHRTSLNRVTAAPQVASNRSAAPAAKKETRNLPAAKVELPLPRKPAAEAPKFAKRVRPPAILKREPLLNQDLQDMQDMRDLQDLQNVNYVEYEMPGMDNRPVPVRLPLPKVIPMRYSQMSEEYFIQNVSH